jgi:hypothetical protein
MTCKQARRLIYELEDATLAPAEIADVRAHVAACGPCARDLRQWERIREGFSAASRPTLPRSVVPAVMQEAAEPRRFGYGFTLHPVFRAAVVVGALALLAGTGLWMLPRGGSHSGVEIPPPRGGPSVGQLERDKELKVAMLGREHALFARGGTALDRTLWTAAATEANLELLKAGAAPTSGRR